MDELDEISRIVIEDVEDQDLKDEKDFSVHSKVSEIEFAIYLFHAKYDFSGASYTWFW